MTAAMGMDRAMGPTRIHIDIVDGRGRVCLASRRVRLVFENQNRTEVFTPPGDSGWRPFGCQRSSSAGGYVRPIGSGRPLLACQSTQPPIDFVHHAIRQPESEEGTPM